MTTDSRATDTAPPASGPRPSLHPPLATGHRTLYRRFENPLGGSVPLYGFRVFPIKVPPPLPSVCPSRAPGGSRRFVRWYGRARASQNITSISAYLRAAVTASLALHPLCFRDFSNRTASSSCPPHTPFVKQDVLVVRRGRQSPRDPTVVRAALLQSTPKASGSFWVRRRLDTSSVESVMFSLLSDY